MREKTVHKLYKTKQKGYTPRHCTYAVNVFCVQRSQRFIDCGPNKGTLFHLAPFRLSLFESPINLNVNIIRVELLN